MSFQFTINSLRDKVLRGVASVKEKAMVEYYAYTRGGEKTTGDWFSTNFFNLPFSYQRMNDWVHYRQAEYEYNLAFSKEAERARRDNFYGRKYLADVDKGYTGTLDDWKRLHIKNLDRKGFESTRWDPTYPNKFLPKVTDSTSPSYLRSQRKGLIATGENSRQFTTLDIETDDYGHPISISALKQVYNKRTGTFEIMDQYQRFYESRNVDLLRSMGVHGLSSSILHKLRKQQFISGVDKYERHYNSAEEESLKKFLGNSIIVGHNIVEFDLPHLFHTPLNNQTIDTLYASRNKWNNQSNDLDSVFKRLFNKSMDQAGLSHHEAMSDVLASSMILQKMLHMKGNTGDALRYVATTAGTHIAPLDSYLNSQVIKGNYTEHANIERYVNMKDYDGTDISIEELMGAKQEFERPYNEDTRRKELPLDMHYEDFSEDFSEGSSLSGDMSLFADSLREVAKDIKSASEINGAFAREMSHTFSTASFMDMRKFRLRAAEFDDPKEREAYIRAAGYGENEVLNIMRGTNELNKLLQDKRNKNIDKRRYEASVNAIQKAMWKAEREGDNESIDILQNALGKSPKDVWNALQDAEDIRKKRAKEASESADNVKRIQDLENDREKFERYRDRIIARGKRHGKITDEQGAELALTNSYEDLSDVMDEIILKNEKLKNIFTTISRIPSYNFEHLRSVFVGEVGGVVGASKGVLPNFIQAPFSRAVSAGINSFNSWAAPGRMAYRFGHIVGNTAMGIGSTLAATGLGVGPGLALMGIGGGISLASQLIGNTWESSVTRKGEGLQNMFNTIGMLKEIILMPFRLLASAIKLVIKGFHTLSSVLKGFTGIMTSGLGNMMQMGNPLSLLSSTTYGNYFGTKLIDMASLQSPGTVNGMLENFAMQQQQLYTTGRLDINRLVAASMLGVFSDVYGPTDNWDSSVGNMINKLSSSMKGQSASQKQYTLALANTINPAVGNILQTMDTLGVSSYEDLKRPRGIFMRGEEDISGWRPGWQRTQWEYQAAGLQLGVSKNRIASSLWGKIGKPVYNTFNSIADSVANAMESGKWKDVVGIIKEGAKTLWSTIKETFGIGDEKTLFGSLKNSILEGGAQLVELLRDKVLPKIYSVWDALTGYMIDKVTDMVSFLSTVRIDWKALLDMVTTGKSDKPWITSILDTKATDDTAYSLENTKSGFQGLQKLATDYDAAHPNHPGILVPKDIGGEIVRGIPYSNLSEKMSGFRTNKDYIDWIESKLKYGSKEDIAELDSLMKNELGYEDLIKNNIPLIYPGANAEDIVEYIVQRHKYGASGANWVHRQYKNLDASKDTPFNQALHKAKEDTDIYRYMIGNDVLSNTADTLRSWKTPTMEINVKDSEGKKASVQVMSDGSVSLLSNNSNVGITVKDGISQFFKQNATRIIGG